MKYKPERDLPEFARELKTLSPSKLAGIILNKRNREVTAESVTMWFKRHPDIYGQLSKELVEGLPNEKQSVDATVFQNGNFEETSSIKNWVLEMNARDLKEKTIQGQLINLRSCLRGNFPILKIDLIAEGKWCLKHPDRFNLNDAMELIAILKERNIDTYQYKRAMKDFLISKGHVIGKKIAVGRSQSYGQYSTLFVEKGNLFKMLNWIKEQNFEAYVCDKFMLKTATRIRATLRSKLEDIQSNVITVEDKGRRVLKQWKKHLSDGLLDDIKKLVGERKTGPIFSITYGEISRLNEQAIKMFCPEILERFPHFHDWNHFFRHMFAQHSLRATDWNYGIVASLGGWTPQALEESYGKPPENIVEEWGDKYKGLLGD